MLPAASRATAVRLCAPFETLPDGQLTEYGAVVSSAPRLPPSTLNCTPTTPTLSEEFAAKLTEPETVAPAAGLVRATVGAVVGRGGGGGRSCSTRSRCAASSSCCRQRRGRRPLGCAPRSRRLPDGQLTEYGAARVLGGRGLASIDLELHADDGDVVGRGGSDARRARDGRASRRAREPNRGGSGVTGWRRRSGRVRHGHGALRARGVAGRVAGEGREGVRRRSRRCRTASSRSTARLVSRPPRLPPSTLNCTPTTATLSDAVAATLAVPETVAPADGLVEPNRGGSGVTGWRRRSARVRHGHGALRAGVVAGSIAGDGREGVPAVRGRWPTRQLTRVRRARVLGADVAPRPP